MKYTITRSHVSFRSNETPALTKGVMVGPPSITLRFLGLEPDVKAKRMLRKHGVCEVTT